MNVPGAVPRHVDSISWQDYRGSDKGMVVYYNTDPVSEIPIREVPEEYPTDVPPDPNYETGTYGLYGCSRPKTRTSFFKSKLRYLFFMTKYAGTNVEYMDQLVVTGYCRINWSADVQKLHIRYLTNYGCISDDTCIALRADQVRFVSIQDAFVLTPEVLDEWGYGSRVTRQTRILIEEDVTSKLLEYLNSKEDRTAEYISETKRLSPDTGEEDEEEDEDGYEEAGLEAVAEEPDETDELTESTQEPQESQSAAVPEFRQEEQGPAVQDTAPAPEVQPGQEPASSPPAQEYAPPSVTSGPAPSEESVASDLEQPSSEPEPQDEQPEEPQAGDLSARETSAHEQPAGDSGKPSDIDDEAVFEVASTQESATDDRQDSAEGPHDEDPGTKTADMQ
ncbi:MAG: hypothetical protein GF410_13320 [Chitinivibrionales bacterium]|nr:hypothetical protein [Chitinivibrionales bacterium]